MLHETRAYRVYGGAGTRVGRIYVGGGASESHQRLGRLIPGILVLTNQRLIFDGGHETRSVNPRRNISKRLVGCHRNQLKPTTEKPNLHSAKPHHMGADDSNVSEW